MAATQFVRAVHHQRRAATVFSKNLLRSIDFAGDGAKRSIKIGISRLPPTRQGRFVYASKGASNSIQPVTSDSVDYQRKYAHQASGSGDKSLEFLPLDTSFNNAEEAYKSKTTGELLRALFVFRLTSLNLLVKHSNKILKLLRKVLGKRLFSYVMKNSFYGQFVAGADVDDISPLIVKNFSYGIKPILDYSVEEDMPEEQAKQKTKKAYRQVPAERGQLSDQSTAPKSGKYDYHEEFGDRRKDVTSVRTFFYDSESQCDKNMWIIMKCIDSVSVLAEGSGLAAIKLTALGRPQLLLDLSRVLSAIENTSDLQTGNNIGDDGKSWFTLLDVPDSSNQQNSERLLNHLPAGPNPETGVSVRGLLAEQETELRSMMRRINMIGEHAAERGVRVMMDAEQTYFQPAISRLTMEMMKKFNRDRAVVFNTYQCYLKSTYDKFTADLEIAKQGNFCFGCKVVRGAYMDQERQRAAAVGYEDPINKDFEATSAMYEKVIDTAMQEITVRNIGAVAIMAATHNEDTVRYCVQRLKEFGIRREDKVICFGQLLGMCDHVSFPLGQSGYSVYKYVPYGPVEEVLPYLSRRAAENSGILAKVNKERRLLWTELKRRMLSRGSKREAR